MLKRFHSTQKNTKIRKLQLLRASIPQVLVAIQEIRKIFQKKKSRKPKNTSLKGMIFSNVSVG